MIAILPHAAYGGAYVPELLIAPLRELEAAFDAARADAGFAAELDGLLRTYAGRPTPLTDAPRFAAAAGLSRVLLKREDLLHTGAHKLNNALGQALLARRLGKRRVIAETGAGQHGVAAATACARLGLDCVVYMGATDMRRQALNVQRMKLLGAEVRPVDAGAATLKEAINAALRDWAESFETTHYCLGSALGPRPFPEIVRYFQSVIGREARAQCREFAVEPDMLLACVGGGSNAIGLFADFLDTPPARPPLLIGVEAGGEGIATGRHAARFAGGRPGVLHGCRTYVLQNGNGQILPTHSISAGLDYPAVGPEHAALHDSGRALYTTVTDEEAVRAFRILARTEGIIPALESSHALAYALRARRDHPQTRTVILCLSGRGDKDLPALDAGDAT